MLLSIPPQLPIAPQADIRDIAECAREFYLRLQQIKASTPLPDANWYPYQSLAIFPVLEQLLTGDRRQLHELCSTGETVLDIGCGDGDIAFFFESLGYRVLAIDFPPTNFNQLRGFEALRTALDSAVELKACDLDMLGLQLSGTKPAGLAICLGLLYHLKNPFALLEAMAKQSKYCLLSTRIAERTPSGMPMANEPVAYLLDTFECNNDPTNFWIFSEAGLRRVCYRAGWDVVDSLTVGADESEPARLDRDRRMLCLLHSRYTDPWPGLELGQGWEGFGGLPWQWTGKTFDVTLRNGRRGSRLIFRFLVPAVLLNSSEPLRIRARAGGIELPARDYFTAGEQEYAADLPEECLQNQSVKVQFELSRVFTPGGADTRQLGLQVPFWTAGTGSHPRSPIVIE